MPFKPPKKPPQFADLKGILAQSKDTENATYQTVEQIIERLEQLKNLHEDKISAINDEISAINKNAASRFATYHTKQNETAILPNSIRLLPGTGITFDDTVPHERTISSSGGGMAGYYDCPLTDGDPVAADLIFAAGECIIVQVPVP
jgi:hypothetical protein